MGGNVWRILVLTVLLFCKMIAILGKKFKALLELIRLNCGKIQRADDRIKAVAEQAAYLINF